MLQILPTVLPSLIEKAGVVQLGTDAEWTSELGNPHPLVPLLMFQQITDNQCMQEKSFTD